MMLPFEGFIRRFLTGTKCHITSCHHGCRGRQDMAGATSSVRTWGSCLPLPMRGHPWLVWPRTCSGSAPRRASDSSAASEPQLLSPD